MKNTLSVCGIGASSGFMTKNIRQAARARNIKIGVRAQSDSVAGDYIEDTDLLLVGPCLGYMLQDLEDITEPHGVAVRVMPKDTYGELDGDTVLDLALPLLED